MGPDKGAGGKSLILAPGAATPADAAGYRVVTSTTVK
jgi:hypothetical protein